VISTPLREHRLTAEPLDSPKVGATDTDDVREPFRLAVWETDGGAVLRAPTDAMEKASWLRPTLRLRIAGDAT
jgi:hypothetical protein